MKKLILLYLLSINLLYADSISIAADEWCPHNCDVDAQNQGYMIDIMKEVFEPLGHTIDYKTFPYSRAIALAKYGKLNAVVGAFAKEVPNFFLTSSELGINTNAYCIVQNNNWKFTGVQSLKNQKLAILQGYSYGDRLDKYIEKNIKNKNRIIVLSDNASSVTALKLLKAKRASVYVEDVAVLQYSFLKYGLTKEYKISGTEEPLGLYIAFSPALDSSKEYAKILGDGMIKLRKSGKLKEILARYGLKDWVK